MFLILKAWRKCLLERPDRIQLRNVTFLKYLRDFDLNSEQYFLTHPVRITLDSHAGQSTKEWNRNYTTQWPGDILFTLKL